MEPLSSGQGTPRYYQNGCVHKLRVLYVGVLVIRIIVYSGSLFGPPVFGNCQIRTIRPAVLRNNDHEALAGCGPSTHPSQGPAPQPPEAVRAHGSFLFLLKLLYGSFQNKGPQIRPQHTMILVIRRLTERKLNFWKSPYGDEWNGPESTRIISGMVS